MDNNMFILGIILAIILGIAVGSDAEKRGMSGMVWGFCTFFMAILVVPIYLIVRTPREEKYGSAKKMLESGMSFDKISKLSGLRFEQIIELQKEINGLKKCEYCAEMIKREAKICRYCGKEVR